MNPTDYGRYMHIPGYHRFIDEKGWKALANINQGDRYIILVDEFDHDGDGKKIKTSIPVSAEVKGVYQHHIVLLIDGKRGKNNYCQSFRYSEVYAMKQTGRLKRN